ncbi:MAG: putative colanic acid biosynthesis glycosyl transferase [Planctomycetaceae bacterium]|nr:putative colanic acid biosynthesis glycosyl transferase [Planctomycetaceae bacterium]
MDSERTRAKDIWLVNLFFGPGAAPTGVLLASLADELLRHGWRVDVLTGTADYRTDFAQTDVPFQGKIHRFRCASTGNTLRSKFRTWLTFYIKVAWFVLWRRLPDVVVVQTTPPFLHTLFAVRAVFAWRRPKIILWNQDTYPESLTSTGLFRPTSWTYRLLQGIARWSGRRIAHAVVLDGAMANRLRQQGVQQITLIPNWDLAPATVAGVTLPDELRQIAEGYRYRIAYTGNLGRGHDLTPVWNYLRKYPTQTDFCFLFVGEGDRTAELRELVQREGWTCVKFWPYLPVAEFSALLHWADFGLVALEPGCLGLMSPSKMHAWLAAGKPVIYIGPQGSNVSETLAAFDCGFSVDPSQPESFERIAEALKTNDLLKQMHLQSRRAWETRHAPDVGRKAWLELLNRC